MKKTITKAKIIEAIMTEPLASGNWFKRDYTNIGEDYSNCTACAVGAVVRKASFVGEYQERVVSQLCDYMYDKESEGYLYDNARSIRRSLKDKQWLPALSSKFESLFRYTPVDNSGRKRLANWVRRNFPSRITIDL